MEFLFGIEEFSKKMCSKILKLLNLIYTKMPQLVSRTQIKISIFNFVCNFQNKYDSQETEEAV